MNEKKQSVLQEARIRNKKYAHILEKTAMKVATSKVGQHIHVPMLVAGTIIIEVGIESGSKWKWWGV